MGHREHNIGATEVEKVAHSPRPAKTARDGERVQTLFGQTPENPIVTSGQGERSLSYTLSYEGDHLLPPPPIPRLCSQPGRESNV